MGIPGHNGGLVSVGLERAVEDGRGRRPSIRPLRHRIRYPGPRRQIRTAWQTVRHFGSRAKLPKVVACRFAPLKTSACESPTSRTVRASPKWRSMAGHLPTGPTRIGLRLARPFPRDCLPTPGAPRLSKTPKVTLSGAKSWRAVENRRPRATRRNVHRPDAAGTDRPVNIRTHSKTAEMELPPVESQDGRSHLPVAARRHGRPGEAGLDGKWKFHLDPPEGFLAHDFDERDWAQINVPAHWEMEGFHGDSGVGGYRRHLPRQRARGDVKLRLRGRL